jgi:steroid delta-isomerase-like uncharacterized protein
MKKSKLLQQKIIYRITLLLIICSFTFYSHGQDNNSLTIQEAEALVEKDMKVYNEGRLDLADEYIAENYVEHTAGYPEDVKGIEGFKKQVTYWRNHYPDFKVTKEELIVKGNRIVWRWIMTGTDKGTNREVPPTGKKINVEGVGIIQVVNGKFVERLMYFNELSVLKQLGYKIIPPNQNQ